MPLRVDGKILHRVHHRDDAPCRSRLTTDGDTSTNIPGRTILPSRESTYSSASSPAPARSRLAIAMPLRTHVPRRRPAARPCGRRAGLTTAVLAASFSSSSLIWRSASATRSLSARTAPSVARWAEKLLSVTRCMSACAPFRVASARRSCCRVPCTVSLVTSPCASRSSCATSRSCSSLVRWTVASMFARSVARSWADACERRRASSLPISLFFPGPTRIARLVPQRPRSARPARAARCAPRPDPSAPDRRARPPARHCPSAIATTSARPPPGSTRRWRSPCSAPCRTSPRSPPRRASARTPPAPASPSRRSPASRGSAARATTAGPPPPCGRFYRRPSAPPGVCASRTRRTRSPTCASSLGSLLAPRSARGPVPARIRGGCAAGPARPAWPDPA